MRRSTGHLYRLIIPIAFLSFSFSAQSQCPIGLDLSTVNLVVNPGFEAGNTDFTSDHNYCNTPGCLMTEGKYTVAADPSIYQPSFTGADHTSGAGNFLIVNGAATANSKVWCQTVSLEQGTYYQISYWISSMVDQNPASIQLNINTFDFFPPFSAPFTTNTWSQFALMWPSGITTSAEVCLLNVNSALNGNDFGIDDIAIRKCECALTIDATGDASICKGDSVQLSGSGSTSYYWTPTNSVNCFTCDNPVASPQVTTVYTVSAVGPQGCTATDTVTIVVYPTLDLLPATDTSICSGQSVQLEAAGAVSYQWSPLSGLSDGGIPNPLATPSSSTTYFVNALDQYGCSQSDSFHITVFQQAEPVITNADTTVCPGSPVLLQVNQGGTISWSPSDFLSCDNCQSPLLAAPDSSITYVVSVTDLNGCFAGTDSVTIQIDTACNIIIPPTMMIPTAFSPNSDGKNDLLTVLGNGIIDFQLDIYNRWGELVFTTKTNNHGWDGTYQGKKQDVGVYVWHLDGNLVNGTHVVKNGNVTLIR